MSGIFSKAKGASKPKESEKATKGCTWSFGKPEDQEVDLGVEITKFIGISGDIKSLETKRGIHKSRLTEAANDRFFHHLSSKGDWPESPTYLVNESGERVTFVVQNRLADQKVSQSMREELVEAIVGDEDDSEKRVELANEVLGHIREEGVYSFDRNVMSDKEFSEVVQESINHALMGVGFSKRELDQFKKAMGILRPKLGDKVDALVNIASGLAGRKLASGRVLSVEDVEGVVNYTVEDRFAPSFIPSIPKLCGMVESKIRQVYDVLGSGITRYVKA